MVKTYIDVESFAKCYIVHELFNDIDVGNSSFYFYKKAGDKLYAGPLWDFDISSGNCNYTTSLNDGNDTEYLYAKHNNEWYKNLLRFDEFKSPVAELLGQYSVTITNTINQVVNYQMEYIDNNNQNFEVWDILSIYVWPNPNELVEINTFEGQLEYLQNWLLSKLEYMKSVYNS